MPIENEKLQVRDLDDVVRDELSQEKFNPQTDSLSSLYKKLSKK